ncbi:hypothetical protein [Peribacillus simplex]|uniref:hypothetical protein n=1 Tax=Peribacillus simplex TaxID=1478 RepID=UPI00366CA8B3
MIDHLQAGGEIEIGGRTYVWLDNHVTRTATSSRGETEYWGIDGLAIKGVSVNSNTGEEAPHYMGQGNMPVQSFVQLAEQITEEDLLGICASSALKSLNKKRYR